MNSNDKGKRGERDFAKWLRDNLHVDASRGVQYQGSPDSPDVTCELPIHFEVKRTERFNAYQAMAQAESDSEYNIPIVAHRRNRGEWLLVMKADDLAEISGIVYLHLRGCGKV